MVTDAANKVAESNEANNASSAHAVSITPLAQLQLTTVTAPVANTAGDLVNISWRVANLAGVSTSASSWSDSVYLSTTPSITGASIYLGQVTHTAPLLPGGSYTSNLSVSLPTNLVTGQYFYVVRADAQGQVAQSDRVYDVGASSADSVTQLATKPSDLSVTNVVAGPETLSGQSLTVDWTLSDSLNATLPNWYDEIYLSRVATLDASAVGLGSFQHSSPLASGSSQTFSASVQVPIGLDGPFYVIVATDVSSALNDPVRTNNSAASTLLQVDLPVPIDLTVGAVSITSAAGNSVSVSYSVSNITPNTSSGSWEDAVYLSTDGIWSIDDPLLGYVQHSGGIGSNGTYSGQLTASLPGLADGNYHAIVRTNVLGNQPEASHANNTGSSTSTVAISQPTLLTGSPATGMLTTGGSAYYQITVAGGQTISLSLVSNVANSANDIYVRYGAVPTLEQFDTGSITPLTQNPTAILQDTQAGTYYVMVRETGGVPETYTLSATPIQFSVTGITPNQASNVGSVTLTIDGAEFKADDQVQVIASDGTVRDANHVDWVNGGEVWATFDLRGLATGAYTVRLVDGTQTASLANSFTVTNGPAGHLAVTLVAPAQLRTRLSPDGLAGNQNGIVTVQYANNGGTDVAAPILDLQAASATFQSGALGLVSPTEIAVVGNSQTGPAGILQPGATETVSYTFAGTPNYTKIILSLGVLQGSNAPIDWNSLQQALQPASIDSTDWGLIWQRFETQVGNDAQGLVTALSKASTTLGQIGEPTNDLGTLLGYEIQQASGTLPNTSLASTTDLADTGTGLDLSLTRFYSASLLDRNATGAFGDGWTFTYGVQAITDGSGKVSITSPSGAEVFTPQTDGSYAGQAGDTSALTLLNGSYTLTSLDGSTETFRPDGKLSAVTDANGNLVTVSYGSTGAIAKVTGSNGQSLTFTTNATGQITAVTDGQGHTVTYTYDATGQHLISASGPGGVTSYQYAPATNPLSANALTQIANPDGTTRSFGYDSQGNLASQAGNGGVGQVSYAYEGPGTVVQTDADGNATTLIYDASGNLAEVQDATGNASRLSYDPDGNLTGIIAPDGSSYHFTYDAAGNLTGYTDPSGAKVEATYKPGTNLLTSFTDQDGNTTNYAFDAAGDLTGTTYDDGKGTTYQYSATGTLMATTDGRGQTTQYTYTGGNLTGEAFSDGTTQTYSYDAKGELLSAKAADGGTTRYAYSTGGNLTSVTDPAGRVESYGYNKGGQEIQRVEPDGSITNYAYTVAGQLAKLTDGSGSLLVQYTYNAAGQLTGAAMGNGATTGYAYDALGNVIQIQTKAADGSVTSQLGYTYDTDSRPVTVTSLDGTWTYSYDAKGELTHAVFGSTNTAIANQDLTYVYDGAGNRTQTIFNGSVTNYTTNGLNQYTASDGTTYGYDPDGNLITKTKGSQTTSYAYNSQNQLNTEVGPSGTITYRYDALGNQVASTVNGVESDYVIDPLAISTSAAGPLSSIAQVYSAGSVTGTYDYGNGLAALITGVGTYYYNLDGIGSVTTLTGPGGIVADQYEYAPFGDAILEDGNVANEFRYLGGSGVVSVPDGALFTRARYYDPTSGRFVTIDPIGIGGGADLYAYANNAPTYQVDPAGLKAEAAPNLFGTNFHDYDNTSTATEVDSLNNYNNKLIGLTGIAAAFTRDPVDAAAALANPSLTPLQRLGGGLGALDFGGGATPSLSLPEIVDLKSPTSVFDTFFKIKDYLVDPILDYFHSGSEAGNNNPTVTVTPIKSSDPNDLVGPSGFGPSAFVTGNSKFVFSVEFENSSTASAPAQQIAVTQQLDPNLDWRTFRLVGFNFDNLTTTLAGNQAFYSGLLDYSTTKGYDVQVTAGVNVITGVVTWDFQTIGPTTGQAPLNPQLGLLPIDDAAGDGEGFVSYTIQAKIDRPDRHRHRGPGHHYFRHQRPNQYEYRHQHDRRRRPNQFGRRPAVPDQLCQLRGRLVRHGRSGRLRHRDLHHFGVGGWRCPDRLARQHHSHERHLHRPGRPQLRFHLDRHRQRGQPGGTARHARHLDRRWNDHTSQHIHHFGS